MSGAPFANGETVTRLRASSTTDAYNDATASWASPSSLDIDGCAVAPSQSSEPVEAGRTAVITGLTVYAPYGCDVVRTDRLVVRGDTYEIDGDLGSWRSPFSGWTPGVEINLKRVGG